MRRSNINIMARLIGLVAPLFPVAVVAIATGVMGFLCSIFITILGGYALLYTLGFHHGLELQTIILLLALCGGLRGVLRYIEQYCNHFIAFKILAIIRDKVFSALRRLAPAKLEGKDKGNLISIITSDVELLEVFYAHTISPVAIAFLISVIMVAFISQFHVGLGFIALCAYITVGIIVPTVTSKLGKETGDAYRGAFGQLNSYLLDSLRGLKETIQYKQGEKRLTKMNELAKVMSAKQKSLNGFEAMTGAVTNMVILLFSAMMFFGAVILYYQNAIGLDGVVLSTIAMMSSFGPVVALANLANNLLQTFASGNRVLDILDEQPAVAEVTDGYEPEFEEMVCDGIDFSYDEEMILSDFSMEIPKNNIIGITGKSGSGKSTLLKLMMRFWDVQRGMIDISNKNIKDIQTSTLRNMQSYVTQTTYLFQDTIENNLKLANLQATSEQIVEACKKASIHDFIMSLPNGYQSKVGELGDTLSGGEKQRLAVARAFLHDSSLILLDEPTSNLDSINEGILLKSLHEEQSGKTIVLVSHRKSTMKIADRTYSVENGRVS